jgi:zinc protease
MAHLLEHMMFKGSTHYADIWAELNKRGAVNNASTWYDRTNYWEVLPAKDDNLAFALDMEADRMTGALIRREDLDKEFSVVRNEFEMGENNAEGILEERMFSTAYLWHNYGKSTIGSRTDIERVPVANLRAFYEKYYQPDNAVLMVAGKIDEKKALDLINQTFGVKARPTRALPPPYTVEPVQDGERQVTLRRVGDVQVVSVLYHTVASSDPDAAAFDALADILTREPSGRLYTALVKSGLATSVKADITPMHDPGAIVISVEVPLSKPIEPVQKKLIEVVEGMGSATITAEEVARYRARAKKEFKQLFANTQELGTEVSEAVACGDWRLIFLDRDNAQKVTAEQIKKVAKAYLVASNRTLGLFLPEKAPLRAPFTVAPDVTALLEGYTGKAVLAAGETFDYTIANIDKRTERSTLAAGLKVALLQKDNKGDTVKAKLTLRFGSAKDFKGKLGAVGLLGEMMLRGTKEHTFQELKDELDVLEAQLTVDTAPGVVTVSISTIRDNLPAVLALANEILHDATFPAAELATLQKTEITDLEASRSDPQTLAGHLFARTVMPRKPDDLLYVPTIDESIARVKAVKVANLKAIYAMLGASHGELVVVGDFDVSALKTAADKYFGKWKSPRPYARIVKDLPPAPGATVDVDTPDKEMALIIAGEALPLRDDDADLPALVVFNQVLGGSGFSSRVMIRLRQKMGISYGAGSALRSDGQDAFGMLIMFAILAPQNAAKGMSAMIEELEGILSTPIPAKEIEEARTSYVKDFNRSLSSDGTIMSLLDESLELGRSLDYYTKLNDAISKVTDAQVMAAAKKWVAIAKLVRVTGLDKKKAAENATKDQAKPATK